MNEPEPFTLTDEEIEWLYEALVAQHVVAEADAA